MIVTGDAPHDPKLAWETQIDHHEVRYSHEPARGWWQRLAESFFRLMPLHREL